MKGETKGEIKGEGVKGESKRERPGTIGAIGTIRLWSAKAAQSLENGDAAVASVAVRSRSKKKKKKDSEAVMTQFNETYFCK